MGELRRPCLLTAVGCLPTVQLLRGLTPPLLRCRVGGPSTEKRRWGGIRNRIFKHACGAAARVPVAAFRRMCPTLDPVGFSVNQMRNASF